MQGHTSIGSAESETARLARLLREAPLDAAPALARSVGRDLAALAYAVLQNRAAAEATAAAAIASAVRRAMGDAPPSGGRGLWVALCGEALRLAVESYAATREVDARDVLDGEWAMPSLSAQQRAMTALSPQQRAVAAGAILGGLDVAELGTALGVSGGRIEQWRRSAERALGSSHALAEHVRRQERSLSLSVSGAQVRHALDAPAAHAGRSAVRRWALAIPISLGLLTGAAALLGPPSAPQTRTGAGGLAGAVELVG